MNETNASENMEVKKSNQILGALIILLLAVGLIALGWGLASFASEKYLSGNNLSYSGGAQNEACNLCGSSQANQNCPSCEQADRGYQKGNNAGSNCGSCDSQGGGNYGSNAESRSWSSVLGMSSEEFSALRSRGLSIEEIATEKGIDINDVIAQILAEEEKALLELVSSGSLTQKDAEIILNNRRAALLYAVKNKPGSRGYNSGGCDGSCGR